MSYVRELVDSRELLGNLTMREIKGKYRRTALGQFWSLLNPLATMLVYTLVFSFIFGARTQVGDPSGLSIYPLWLMCALLPWTFFTRVVNGGLSSLVANSSLIKKVYFPRMHLPLAVATSTSYTWATEMALLAVVLMLCGAWVLPWIPMVLVFMVFLAMFASGLSMLLAIANVHFRDLQHFTVIILQMWMYLTPIVYPITLVEEAAAKVGDWVLTVYRLNPMERFVTVFRNFMYDNRWPETADMLWCVGWAVGMFALGFIVFSRNEKRLAELL